GRIRSVQRKRLSPGWSLRPGWPRRALRSLSAGRSAVTFVTLVSLRPLWSLRPGCSCRPLRALRAGCSGVAFRALWALWTLWALRPGVALRPGRKVYEGDDREGRNDFVIAPCRCAGASKTEPARAA